MALFGIWGIWALPGRGPAHASPAFLGRLQQPNPQPGPARGSDYTGCVCYDMKIIWGCLGLLRLEMPAN
jgi:hypothetical protein